MLPSFCLWIKAKLLNCTWDHILSLPPFLSLFPHLTERFLQRALFSWNGKILNYLFYYHSNQNFYFSWESHLVTSNFLRMCPFPLIFKHIDVNVFMIICYHFNLYGSCNYVSFFHSKYCLFVSSFFPGLQFLYIFKAVVLTFILNIEFISY